MRTGVSYMGHHNPDHLKTDFQQMQELRLDDVFLCAQENDFVHFTGKLEFTPQIARDHGVRPIALFWGALNLFGGGRSSQFLLEHPEGFQVAFDGSHRSEGCYVNPVCVSRIEEMIDRIAELGYEAYFVDEPTPLRDCYCPSCRDRYGEWFGGDLGAAGDEAREAFRQKCVVEYQRQISDYCKEHHPSLETMTCVMPVDRDMWAETAAIASLDNLGTDLYWINNDNDLAGMAPMIHELRDLCAETDKVHHEWLQCWAARSGREKRILDHGEILVRERPDALYVWAWRGQVGTTETCENPDLAWKYACEVLRMAKEQ